MLAPSAAPNTVAESVFLFLSNAHPTPSAAPTIESLSPNIPILPPFSL